MKKEMFKEIKDSQEEMKKDDSGKVRFNLFNELMIFECDSAILSYNAAIVWSKIETTCGSEANAMYEVHRVFSFGAEKYGAYNWQNPCDKQRFYNAFCRHERAYRRGEIVNKEDGSLLHLAQMLFNLIAFDYHSKKETACQDQN